MELELIITLIFIAHQSIKIKMIQAEEIRNIVTSAFEDKILVDYWYFYLLIIISTFGSFFGAYLQNKGKNLATKEDIGTITNEVKKIEAKYLEQIEEYKKQLENRYKAEKVAELFARAFYTDQDDRDFNRLNWELSLYLPKEIVCEISQKLVSKQSPADAMKVLILVRNYFGINDGLEWDNIAYTKPQAPKTE